VARFLLAPRKLDQIDARTLGIEWSDGHRSEYDVRALRLACACAHCVQEWTGQVMVRPEDVPADVHPLSLEPVGNYGLRFDWSDGHSTGIYTFERLRALCGCAGCAAARAGGGS
jgi:ATP-binding protein involved in chromosome partitioning